MSQLPDMRGSKSEIKCVDRADSFRIRRFLDLDQCFLVLHPGRNGSSALREVPWQEHHHPYAAAAVISVAPVLAADLTWVRNIHAWKRMKRTMAATVVPRMIAAASAVGEVAPST